MREKMSVSLAVPVERISIKAKTMEGSGLIGTEAAIAAQAVALISFQ